MKFARYLEDTQTPEWKKAYIDYRRLKKLIAAIRKSREGIAQPESPSITHTHTSDLQHRSLPGEQRRDVHPVPSGTTQVGGDPALSPRSAMAAPTESQDLHPDGGQPFSPSNLMKNIRRGTLFASARPHTASPPLPLRELIPRLMPTESAFFTALDAELDKVERFYLDREKEFLARTRMLEEQLHELGEHRRLFYAAHPRDSNVGYTWSSLKKSAMELGSQLHKTRLQRLRHRDNKALRGVGDNSHVDGQQSYSDGEVRLVVRCEEERMEQVKEYWDGGGRKTMLVQDNPSGSASAVQRHVGESSALGVSAAPPENPRWLDPDDYLHAKKKLKKAVLEHYRGLEVLNNYRILNVTGFRKALKKFEKVTKIPVMDAYMKEKVELCAFASDETVSAMIKEMEALFTARFEHGDKKRAMATLRTAPSHRGHHFSIFRSGFLLGLAVPALVSGLYQSFQEHTRAAIPGWAPLLFVWGVFLIPVLFSLLVGLNLLAWSQSRINYVFIFELNTRTRLDHRQYFEIPALLLTTLIYAFWLSFSRIGSHTVHPTVWPLVWLAFMAFVLINPLPILFQSSRWWLLKTVGRLMISGFRRVEFADFWMGDQFCSLVFTLSNLYFVGCAYTGSFDGSFERCDGLRSKWAIIFVLSALPFFVRLVQSVKRYADSRLITHLINGGKYGAGIISTLFYCVWRHQGRSHGAVLVIWCFTTTCYAIYASSWDLLMDWSVLQPRAVYLFLRSELVYTRDIPMYYVAIVSNVVLRFSWVMYIPTRGPSMLLRTFVASLLEMMRRWLWNFYRVENEHLGNMDQYRVTREVPLPYSMDQLGHEDDTSDEDGRSSRRWVRRVQTPSPTSRPRTSEAIQMETS